MDCVDPQRLMMFRTQACLIMIFVQPQTDKYSARGVRKNRRDLQCVGLFGSHAEACSHFALTWNPF